MSLVETPYFKYHKLTEGANKYCSHYDNTLENCGPLSLEDYARKHVANQRKNYFSTVNCYACRHSPYSPKMATNDLHSFRSLQSFLAEKY